MMDLSDGLAADLPRLAAASHCGSLVEEQRLPLASGRTPAQALGDGEDYELLFALAPRLAARLEAAWKKRFPRRPLTRIGQLTPLPDPRPPISDLRSPISAPPHGYDHFAKH
jgi:thiamine-monophosphate kinase